MPSLVVLHPSLEGRARRVDPTLVGAAHAIRLPDVRRGPMLRSESFPRAASRRDRASARRPREVTPAMVSASKDVNRTPGRSAPRHGGDARDDHMDVARRGWRSNRSARRGPRRRRRSDTSGGRGDRAVAAVLPRCGLIDSRRLVRPGGGRVRPRRFVAATVWPRSEKGQCHARCPRRALPVAA